MDERIMPSCRFIHSNCFLLFVQRHPNRQIGVDRGHFHFHHCRLLACRRQREGIRGIIQQIAVRSGNFLQAVAASGSSFEFTAPSALVVSVSTSSPCL